MRLSSLTMTLLSRCVKRSSILRIKTCLVPNPSLYERMYGEHICSDMRLIGP